jgi:hypothetical protein
VSSIGKTQLKETVMTYVSAIGSGASEGLADALRAEFGAVLAARIIEAEEVDFLWDARVSERYLGQYFGPEFGLGDDDEGELSRIAIMSLFDGSWQVAMCLVDGDGEAVALLWRHCCERREEAQAAFERAV